MQLWFFVVFVFAFVSFGTLFSQFFAVALSLATLLGDCRFRRRHDIGEHDYWQPLPGASPRSACPEAPPDSAATAAGVRTRLQWEPQHL